jgi:LuxR family transcriptional regulator, maltose regulon positive regulatory protein
MIARAGRVARIRSLLKRRPGLGTMAGEAEALRARLTKERGSSVPGSSALTAAELRLLPLLLSHLSFPEIPPELFLSPHFIKAQMKSIYRKLGASIRSQAVAGPRRPEPQPPQRPVHPPQRSTPGTVTAR